MQGKRVLVIANDPSIVWDIGHVMIEKGFSVTATTYGEDGFRQLERNNFDYFIIDTDIQEISIFVYLAYCRRYFPDTKMVLLTEPSSSILQESGLMANTHCCYVAKPVNPDAICDLMSEADICSNFVGIISRASLIDYIEYSVDTKERKVLMLKSKAGEEGKIYIDQGEIVYAECSGKQGEEAFYHCLSFPGGTFWELSWEEPPKRITQVIHDPKVKEATKLT
jgi:ActR/RegA family two-component response regulator